MNVRGPQARTLPGVQLVLQTGDLRTLMPPGRPRSLVRRIAIMLAQEVVGMKKIQFLIVFLFCGSVCFSGSIISLSIEQSPVAIGCCEFKFDPVVEGSNSQGKFAIKNLVTLVPVTYTISVNSPFKLATIGTPSSTVTKTLLPGTSNTISVLLNNAPSGFSGTSKLTIDATGNGTTQSVPGWFVAAHVVPKQADLTIAITGLNAVLAQGNKRQVTLNVAVTNKGFDGGPTAQVQISVDGRVETTFQFVSVPVGSTISQSNIQFLTSASGPNHKINAFVDSTNIVPEFNETNNTAEITKDFP